MTVHAELARLCSEVYSRKDRDLLTVKEVDAHVWESGNNLILTFRGTEASGAWPINWSREGLSNTRDIIRDLRFIPWRDPISKKWVHKGFGKSAYWWFCEFAWRIDKNASIIVTGHSLGAAIAPLVARMLKMSGYNVVEVVCFGEPKGHYFGSAKHYRSLDISTTSYRHSNDWIRWAGSGGTSVKPVIINSRGLSWIESHDIEEYQRSVELML